MAIERITITSEEQWLELRKQDVTASVVGALAGDHPYVTIYRLNAEKRGVEFPAPDRDNPILRRGRWLEAAFPMAVRERRPDLELKPARIYVRDTDLRFGATPDFFIGGDERGMGVLQAKTVAPHIFARDWDHGREPPRWVVLQTLAEMLLTGAAFGMIAAIVVDPFNMDLYLHEIPRHPSAEARLQDLVRRFWDDVDAGREPAADFTRDGETISAMLNKSTAGKRFDATGNNALPEILAERAKLMAEIKQKEARCEAIENEIQFMLGDAEAVTNLPGWTVSYKSSERAGYSVPTKVIRSLRIYDRRPEHEKPQGTEEAAE